MHHCFPAPGRGPGTSWSLNKCQLDSCMYNVALFICRQGFYSVARASWKHRGLCHCIWIWSWASRAMNGSSSWLWPLQTPGKILVNAGKWVCPRIHQIKVSKEWGKPRPGWETVFEGSDSTCRDLHAQGCEIMILSCCCPVGRASNPPPSNFVLGPRCLLWVHPILPPTSKLVRINQTCFASSFFSRCIKGWL